MQTEKMEVLLKGAEELENKYNWLRATRLYKQALVLASGKKDVLKASKLRMRLGFCFFKYALQAEKNEDLKFRMKRARESYEQAIRLYKKTKIKLKWVEILTLVLGHSSLSRTGY